MVDSELPHHDLVDVYQRLDDLQRELSVLVLRATQIDLHIQMVDRNIERLVQLVARRKD